MHAAHRVHTVAGTSRPCGESARSEISAMPPAPQPTEAVFVGRHHELVELRAGLEDAATGRGRVFLVVGEAGIGNTRLVEELAREAAAQGHLVLWGGAGQARARRPTGRRFR